MVIETNQQTSSGPTNTGYISFKQLMVIETLLPAAPFLAEPAVTSASNS